MSTAVVARAVTINRPREQLFAFWRDFSNLAKFMESIERIDTLDDHRSHWVVKAPAGHSVEWDAEVTGEEPGRRIEWRSAAGADIKNFGYVEFKDAPPGRGTEIHAHIEYEPPGGELGRTIAKMFQMEPGMQAHRDLRRLKMLMEAGEIATTDYPDATPRLKKSDPNRADA